MSWWKAYGFVGSIVIIGLILSGFMIKIVWMLDAAMGPVWSFRAAVGIVIVVFLGTMVFWAESKRRGW